MDIGIKFPSEEDVVQEDARRFHALSPLRQWHTIDEMFRLHQRLISLYLNPAVARRLADEDKEAERRAIREFVDRCYA
jgi:hypothetical protein